MAWFDNSFLDLNINKTKELCFGGKQGTTKDAIRIKGQQVEQVSSFKYLGTVLDGKLTFTENCDSIYKKARQRLFLLRRLRNLNVAAPILVSVYRCLIESIMTFNMVTWYGNLSERNKSKLSQIINQASKITGIKQAPLQHLYGLAMKRKALQIVDDCSHPLHSSFQKLPSGRRLRVPMARKNTYKKLFVPSAITILNNGLNRDLDLRM